MDHQSDSTTTLFFAVTLEPHPPDDNWLPDFSLHLKQPYYRSFRFVKISRISNASVPYENFIIICDSRELSNSLEIHLSAMAGSENYPK